MSATRPAAALFRSASRLPARTLSRAQPQTRPTLNQLSGQPAALSPTTTALRYAHSIPKPPRTRPPPPPTNTSTTTTTTTTSSTSATDEPPISDVKARKLVEPHYRITFTCVPCSERSTHVISKQGYHRGSVLITCPGCRNRHVMSDHLNIFGDRKMTVEDLLREKGQLVKRGTLGEDGDVEFWQDENPEGAPPALP